MFFAFVAGLISDLMAWVLDQTKFTRILKIEQNDVEFNRLATKVNKSCVH